MDVLRRLIVLLALIGLFSCSTSAHGPLPRPTTTSGLAPTVGPSASPSATPSCPDRVFASMTEAQRVGQLFVAGLRGDRLGRAEIAGIRTHHYGSVTFIQTTAVGVAGVRAVTDAVQALATDEVTGKVGFYVAANQEGGTIQALRGPGFSDIPPATEQGQMAPAALRAKAMIWGSELLEAGVNFDFAPVMDVVPPGTDAQNQPIGVLRREYGHDVQTVGVHGVAFIEGMTQAGVALSAKHFPGLGRVLGNTDFTADVVDRRTTLDDPYLGTFQQAVDAGVPFVMVALATYRRVDPDHLAVFSPTVMGALRDRMGFDGVIVSDDIGAAVAIADIPPGERAVDFLSAGGDMIVSKYVEPANKMATAVLSRANSDPRFKALVDDAARRILSAKDASSLLPCSP